MIYLQNDRYVIFIIINGKIRLWHNACQRNEKNWIKSNVCAPAEIQSVHLLFFFHFLINSHSQRDTASSMATTTNVSSALASVGDNLVGHPNHLHHHHHHHFPYMATKERRSPSISPPAPQYQHHHYHHHPLAHASHQPHQNGQHSNGNGGGHTTTTAAHNGKYKAWRFCSSRFLIRTIIYLYDVRFFLRLSTGWREGEWWPVAAARR